MEEEKLPSSNGGSLSGSEARFLSDSFECSICSDDMTTKSCVVTNCGHCFCQECLTNWEASQSAKNLEIKCPQCNQLLKTYEQFKWPLFIKSFREELVAKLRKFEREKASLISEKDKVQEQLAKDRRQQELLQRTVDDLRNVTVKKNEMDIRKLRQQISDLEETLSHAGKDKAQNEEKRRELEEARARMGGLESQSEQLAAELAQRQLDVEQLRQEMARGAALLAEKQRELARLQEREADNAGLMEKQAAETSMLPSSPVYYLSRAAEMATDLGERGWKLASKLFARRSSTVLLRSASEFEMKELRGTHSGSSLWRALDLQERGEDAKDLKEEDYTVAVKWKRATVPSEAFREAMILSTLSHENVMPLLGLIDEETRVGLVMPFFDLDLEFLLASDNTDGIRLEVGSASRIFGGLLAAVSYAHAQEIVHGNISSRAVLLRRERGGVLSVVLGGWTVAGSLTGEGLSSSCVSSSAWRYASPERVLELGGASKADDVWACGSVLWELLGESSLTPLVAPARRELGARLSALLRWEELRAAANNWLRALPQERARAAAAALQRALDDNAASASLREQLSERMAAPSAVALLLRLLSWDAAQRGAAHAALLDPWLQHAPPRQTPRHLDHPSALSDHALQAWIRAIRQ